VTFKDKIPKEKIPLALQKAHLFLFTSSWEGTPTVILEALACGLPVVTSNAGGIAEIIKSGKNGFVIEDPLDISAYKLAIQKLHSDKELYYSIVKQNQEKAHQFHWSKVASRITDLMING